MLAFRRARGIEQTRLSDKHKRPVSTLPCPHCRFGRFDGFAGVALMMWLVPMLGVYGAVIGSIAAACCISVPANLVGLAREEGGSMAMCLRPLRPWLARFVPIVFGVTLLVFFWTPHGLWTFAPMAAAIAAIYVVAMLPMIRTPPLGPMLAARLQPWLSRAPRLARHLTKPADALAR